MSVKERILSLKLLELRKTQALYMNKIGITVTLTKKPKSDDGCNTNKGVTSDDKRRN